MATNTALIVIGGKVHSLGRWGSTEAEPASHLLSSQGVSQPGRV